MCNKRSNKPVPHVHAEIIKAWADGKKIEVYDDRSEAWIYTDHPAWCFDNKYRVKPVERVAVYRVAYEHDALRNVVGISESFYEDVGSFKKEAGLTGRTQTQILFFTKKMVDKE